jgi:hypothetical protein
MLANTLFELLIPLAPIDGISIGNNTDKTTWRIDFKPTATAAQKITAQAAIDNFDVTAFATKDASDAAALVIDAATAKADTAITALKAMTPSQARAWVAANVNTLVDAKSLLGTMAAVLCVLARRL